MPSPTFDDLLDIVRRLLGEQGCEWDRAQTPTSLLPYLVEEAYEVREAVLSGEERNLAEELGDLALHVAFQCVLAETRGAFAPGDVFGGIVEKMVRRHPHVFEKDGAQARAEPVSAPDWERLKRRDRAGTAGGGTLDGLPRALPALHGAQRLQERAAGVGFDWPAAAGALSKVREELEEVARHLGDAPAAAPALEEELGDLLFAGVNLARKAGFSAEEALERANAKFRRRFEHLEELAADRGLELGSAGLEELDALWDVVKAAERRRT